jgi:hypothetical protein
MMPNWILGLALLVGNAQAAALGPAVTVKQVTPPKILVPGVKTLEVQAFKGLRGEDVANQIKTALADTERLATDSKAVSEMAIETGAQLAGQTLGGMVGGLGNGITKSMTKGAVENLAEELESEPLLLDDGLYVKVFDVVDGNADAVLTGTITVTDKVDDYKTKEQIKDDKGVAKDAFKLIRQEDWEAARCAFDGVATANPENAAALMNRGVLLEAFGFNDAAEAAYLASQGLQAKKPVKKALKRLGERKVEIEALTSAYGLTWNIGTEPPPCT